MSPRLPLELPQDPRHACKASFSSSSSWTHLAPEVRSTTSSAPRSNQNPPSQIRVHFLDHRLAALKWPITLNDQQASSMSRDLAIGEPGRHTQLESSWAWRPRAHFPSSAGRQTNSIQQTKYIQTHSKPPASATLQTLCACRNGLQPLEEQG